MARQVERPSTLSIIDSCFALSVVQGHDRTKLVDSSTVALATKGEAIWNRGEPITFAAIVGTGFVKMAKATAQGTQMTVELLGPGQCFGLLAAIDMAAYPLSAYAVTDTWYLKMSKAKFSEIFALTTQAGEALLKALAPRLRRAHNMMAQLSSGTVELRIAAVLVTLLDSYSRETRAGTKLTVPLTRQDLAEMAGTTLETTSRVMSRWQKEGLVSTVNQWTCVHDVARLNDMVTS